MRTLLTPRALLAVLVGVGCASAEDPRGGPVAQPPPPAPRAENRLARERSPYLRQHRLNPVDWHPWGPEALALAAREGKPIFLSVGYAACHWCHVMEHESFEDEGTARLLNETFVCVKVDREERPDLDRVYMSAVQLLTGRGGWPMTVLLTPDGRPFFGGTYFPRPQLQDLTRRVREAWAGQREALDQQATAVAERVRALSAGHDLPPVSGGDAELVTRLAAALAEDFDPVHGGYGQRPKFPPHSELLLLLEQGDAESLAMARKTLEAIDEGGVHDQLGGGFHRYSTDERWLVPHFEKMLYDNALLAQAYSGMFAATRETRFARAARRALGWVVRELARPGGGFASSLDADTQGHEGLTYVWTPAEVDAALPAAEAAFVKTALDVTAAGNYEEEATGEATGRSIPRLLRPLAETAAAQGLSVGAFHARLDAALERLRAARDKRPQPGLDDKCIASWNGLLLSAFARAGQDLAEPAWLERGRSLADFLLAEHRREDGTLLRFPRTSGPEIPGFAEDLVHVATGLLDIGEATGEATGEARYTAAARALADDLLARFEDRESGGLWASAVGTHETLIARAKEVWDSPIPSDNGAGARLLLRLSASTGGERYRVAADRILLAYRPLLGHAQTARGVVALCRALALRLRLEASAPAPEALGAGDAHVEQGVAVVDAWLERGEARPGASVRYALRVKLAEGWHVNATEAPPGRVATTLALVPKSPVNLGPPTWPRAGDVGPEAAPGFAGTFWVRGEVHVPAAAPLGPRRVSLVLTLQPCDASSCRAAEDLRLDLALRFAEAEAPARHPAVFAK